MKVQCLLQKFTSRCITQDLRISHYCLAALLLRCHPEKRRNHASPIPKMKASSYGLLAIRCMLTQCIMCGQYIGRHLKGEFRVL